MRALRFQRLTRQPLDLFIIGGGISGAALYQAAAGWRTAIIDRGDFASGTSQASGMLVWGGLLYLNSLDFLTVARFCSARNRLMQRFPEAIAPLDLHFESARAAGVPAWLLRLGLQAYWWLGGRALRRPWSTPEATHAYQEGMLREADSRFVLNQITPWDDDDHFPLPYTSLTAARFDRGRRLWRLEVRDERTGKTLPVEARTVVNACGVWTDRVNTLLGLRSPYRHLLSKGVYLNLRRHESDPAHATIYPMPGKADVLTHVPWGPVMMWGPTETPLNEPEEGFEANDDDLRFLMESAANALQRPIDAREVVSLRSGVRPLAVPVGQRAGSGHPLELSRRSAMAVDAPQQALSLYGGKFTSSFDVARAALQRLKEWLPPRRFPAEPHSSPEPETITHPALPDTPFPSPDWAREREHCLTLEDYLRRRTPLAQWIDRGALGACGEYRPTLLAMAQAFCDTPAEAQAMLASYEEKITTRHDPLLRSST